MNQKFLNKTRTGCLTPVFPLSMETGDVARELKIRLKLKPLFPNKTKRSRHGHFGKDALPWEK